jgi:hypothetical protein
LSTRHLTTARLQLDAVVPEDLDEHFALMSDPGVWAHLPSGRHSDPTHPAAGGDVVGTGGCAVRVHGVVEPLLPAHAGGVGPRAGR